MIDLDAMHEAAAEAARLMKTLANPDRLMLLCQLSQGEMSVGELEASLGIMQPSEGLVDTRREGKHIYYRVLSPQALAVLQVLYAQFCEKRKKR